MVEQTYELKSIPKIQKRIAVLWPSFLMAGLATILFFAVVDPVELAPALGLEYVDRLAAYSIGFFLFWLLTGFSSGLTCYFEKPCDEINRTMRSRNAKRTHLGQRRKQVDQVRAHAPRAEEGLSAKSYGAQKTRELEGMGPT
jgi:hypothetical protein